MNNIGPIFVTAIKIAQGREGKPFQLNLSQVLTYQHTDDGRTFIELKNQGMYLKGYLRQDGRGVWCFSKSKP